MIGEVLDLLINWIKLGRVLWSKPCFVAAHVPSESWVGESTRLESDGKRQGFAECSADGHVYAGSGVDD